jgi:hypothetical protein
MQHFILVILNDTTKKITLFLFDKFMYFLNYINSCWHYRNYIINMVSKSMYKFL